MPSYNNDNFKKALKQTGNPVTSRFSFVKFGIKLPTGSREEDGY